MVNIKSKYNLVEIPRKFTIAELSIRKLGSSSLIIIMHYYINYISNNFGRYIRIRDAKNSGLRAESSD